MRHHIVKAVRTCLACPSQWDAWTGTGTYLYLRFRHGIGTADLYPSGRGERVGTSVRVAEFQARDGLGGVIELDDFCARTGIELAPDADVSYAEPGYVRPTGGDS